MFDLKRVEGLSFMTLVIWKMTRGILQIFARALESVKIGTLI